MIALVGYTGFVGSNIYGAGKFDAVYNSKNIEEAFGTNPDILVFAGLRAEKYLANKDPQSDLALIKQAWENICKINPKKLVLISTIDVFKDPKNVDENSEIDTVDLCAYGYNRYLLETYVREKYPDALIVRLPGLFGKNIKKNFIYDLIHVIPFMLTTQKFEELSGKDASIKDFYFDNGKGFFQLQNASLEDQRVLRQKFLALGFSALNFTDSRSTFQFYPLSRLWGDIQTALANGLKLWHPATEPISVAELYQYVKGSNFENVMAKPPMDYDYRTIHDGVFGGKNGYILGKAAVLEEIENFIQQQEALL